MPRVRKDGRTRNNLIDDHLQIEKKIKDFLNSFRSYGMPDILYKYFLERYPQVAENYENTLSEIYKRKLPKHFFSVHNLEDLLLCLSKSNPDEFDYFYNRWYGW